MKKLIALFVSAALAFEMLALSAFANEPAVDEFDDISMREAQTAFLEYLESKGLELQLGTQEYYDYISRQLLELADADLLAAPNYDLIHAYMVEYKTMYEDFLLVTEQMQLGGGSLDETNCLKLLREEAVWRLFAFEGRVSRAADEVTGWLLAVLQ